MSEKRILIASILKPINDTRMFEKLGLSLSKLPDTQVHIAGFQAPVPEAPDNVYFHPLFNFHRLSVRRFLAQRQYMRLLEKIKPHLVIASTHELLRSSQEYCRRYGAKLMYDVQENYALNLTSQGHYPPLLRQLLAFGVRKAESKAAPDVAHFLLAERSYAAELPFLPQGKYSILENKYQAQGGYSTPATPVTLANAPLRLLYSGTIAAMNGVFEAVDLVEKLHQQDGTTTLTIIGYCAQSQELQQLRQRISGKGYIRMIGGEHLVPHAQILQAISQSNVGLLPYRPNPSTARCVPTKLYEYMAYALPMLVQQNPLWQELLEQHQAGLSIDFQRVKADEVRRRLRQQRFYTAGAPHSVFWQTEEEKLLSVVKTALSGEA